MFDHAKRTWTFHYTKEHYLSYITLSMDVETGALKKACSSCAPVLCEFGVKDGVKK
ncbi:MAG: Unknown protein [uncultured Sulfurovum sp.]|uniref:Uncharacterized protein n=1 Tax=uncultured Sulfurovum sp. TaxID=269237 RepID=A0A6S6T1S3_9BACT|nr:MAG: Unknown protein [uncultured Sulfurovum sp.]